MFIFNFLSIKRFYDGLLFYLGRIVLISTLLNSCILLVEYLRRITLRFITCHCHFFIHQLFCFQNIPLRKQLAIFFNGHGSQHLYFLFGQVHLLPLFINEQLRVLFDQIQLCQKIVR